MNHEQTRNHEHEQTAAHHRSEATGVDAPYTFGRPASTYLAPREIVRLTILRSKMRETRLQLEALPVGETEPNAE
jgi:hypothetical protein